jgi:hypothetical protein
MDFSTSGLVKTRPWKSIFTGGSVKATTNGNVSLENINWILKIGKKIILGKAH